MLDNKNESILGLAIWEISGSNTDAGINQGHDSTTAPKTQET